MVDIVGFDLERLVVEDAKRVYERKSLLDFTIATIKQGARVVTPDLEATITIDEAVESNRLSGNKIYRPIDRIGTGR